MKKLYRVELFLIKADRLFLKQTDFNPRGKVPTGLVFFRVCEDRGGPRLSLYPPLPSSLTRRHVLGRIYPHSDVSRRGYKPGFRGLKQPFFKKFSDGGSGTFSKWKKVQNFSRAN